MVISNLKYFSYFIFPAAKSFVYLCETVTVQITDVTSAFYNVAWTVTSSNGNSVNENLIANMLTSSLSISPMTLLHNTQYKLKAQVSDGSASKVKEVTIQTVGYPIYSITSPTSAAFLSWWENEGTLLGCATCSASSPNAVPACLTCSTPLQKNSEGSCLCQDQNSYIDLTNFPQVSCQSKSNSVASWSLLQKSPNIQMQTNFDNGFAFNEAHLKYIAATIAVQALSNSITLQDYSAISNKPTITLSFTIPQSIVSGATIELTNLSEYNKLPYSPFLIKNPHLTYQLPATTYLSPETTDTLTTAGETTAAAMTAQVIASAIMPAVTGGLSTFAMLLMNFLAEIDIYMYVNVPYPENFVVFCKGITTDMLPNLWANFDENSGANPISTIGKFKFWEISATFLDNCFVNTTKDLIVLGIIVAANILMIVFNKCPHLYSLASKVRDLFMWNIFLSFYIGDYSELQLNAMIELREHSVSSLYSNVSLALSIIIVVSYTFLKIYIFYLLNRKPRNRNAVLPTVDGKPIQPNVQESCVVPPRVAIIIEDFVDKNAFTRNFFLVMMGEDFIMILLVFFFQNYGLAQAIFYTILTIGYIAIIVWQQPFKSKIKLLVLLINLTSKTIMGIFAIIFGINEKTNSIPEENLTRMGTALIVLIIAVIVTNLLIALLITVVELIQKIKERVNQMRAHSKNSKNPIAHQKTINRTHSQREHFYKKPVRSKTLQPNSFPVALQEDNPEDSGRDLFSRATSLKVGYPINSPHAEDSEREFLARTSSMKARHSINSPHAKDPERELNAKTDFLKVEFPINSPYAKIASPHDSMIDSTSSPDHSLIKFIVPNNNRTPELKPSDRISRLRERDRIDRFREWKQLHQDQKVGFDQALSDRTELKENINLSDRTELKENINLSDRTELKAKNDLPSENSE